MSRPALAVWALRPYALLTLTAALALGLFALSFDLVLGVTGLVSVSHATLFGVGAYGMAIAMMRLQAPFWASLLVGIAAAAAMAWLIGFFSVRTSGPGFIIMTAIFAHAIEHIANVWTGLTGGENGIILDVHFAAGSVVAYYVVAACLVAGFAACRWLVGSRLGLVLRGIKGNEMRALALGTASASTRCSSTSSRARSPPWPACSTGCRRDSSPSISSACCCPSRSSCGRSSAGPGRWSAPCLPRC
jgi:ABC-type branched-subunit amino acid transport system permease subunit